MPAKPSGYPLCVRIPVHSAEAVCTRIPHSVAARLLACLHASVLLGAYVSVPLVACQPRGAYQACFIGSVPLGDDYTLPLFAWLVNLQPFPAYTVNCKCLACTVVRLTKPPRLESLACLAGFALYRLRCTLSTPPAWLYLAGMWPLCTLSRL